MKTKTVLSVDCHQLKQTGARSAGSSVACNDFILTACMRNMKMWRDPIMLSWTWAERSPRAMR
jgi:hypothetical protein